MVSNLPRGTQAKEFENTCWLSLCSVNFNLNAFLMPTITTIYGFGHLWFNHSLKTSTEKSPSNLQSHSTPLLPGMETVSLSGVSTLCMLPSSVSHTAVLMIRLPIWGQRCCIQGTPAFLSTNLKIQEWWCREGPRTSNKEGKINVCYSVPMLRNI